MRYEKTIGTDIVSVPQKFESGFNIIDFLLLNISRLTPHASCLFSKLLNLILPPLCLSCRVPVAAAHAVCVECWNGLQFIEEPRCMRCGLPFEIDYGADTVCAGCLADEPQFEFARTALVYNDMSKNLILALKHGDQWHGVPAFSAWLERAVRDVGTVDYIVPVPLHFWRRMKRKYNQAALLAKGLAKRTGQQVVPDLLQRRRATTSQGSLRRKGRFRNVEGAFRLNPKSNITGKSVLLVDDVMTTGATIKECTKVLLRAGASSVKVVTLARVV